MKKIHIIIILMLCTVSSFASTRGDVQIIEASENMQYLGQKIATDYFLLYRKANNYILQNQFEENIKQLEKNIADIANTTQNAVTTYLLKFYRIRLVEIKKLINKETTKENAIELLNASRYFLEGARKIAEEHQYKLSKEEDMLVRCKELIYLIESTSKFYMAFQIGLKKNIKNTAMQNIIIKIDEDLKSIGKYSYDEKLKKKLFKIKDIWEYNQTFLKNPEGSAFTNLLLYSNSYIKTLLIDLETHHKMNL